MTQATKIRHPLRSRTLVEQFTGWENEKNKQRFLDGLGIRIGGIPGAEGGYYVYMTTNGTPFDCVYFNPECLHTRTDSNDLIIACLRLCAEPVWEATTPRIGIRLYNRIDPDTSGYISLEQIERAVSKLRREWGDNVPVIRNTLLPSYQVIVYRSDETAQRYSCERFSEILAELKLTSAEAATVLQVDSDLIEDYQAGRKKPSDSLLGTLGYLLKERLETAQILAQFADSQRGPVHYQIVADPEPYGKREYNLPDTFSLHVSGTNFNMHSCKTIAQGWLESALNDVLERARKAAKPGKIA